MSDQKFFRSPFAFAGDKVAIPDAIQPGGAVSYTQGWGPDYERDPETDPLAKRLPRDGTNQLYFDITDNIRQYQLSGFPEWVTPAQNGDVAVAYEINTYVRYNDAVYCSLVNANTALPTDATKWAPVVPVNTDALLRANNLSDLANVATARTNLGLGTMATQAAGSYLPKNAPDATGGFTLAGAMKENVIALDGTEINAALAGGFTKAIAVNTAFTVIGATVGKIQAFALFLSVSGGAEPSFPAGTVRWAYGVQPIFGNGNHVVVFLSFGSGFWVANLTDPAFA